MTDAVAMRHFFICHDILSIIIGKINMVWIL